MTPQEKAAETGEFAFNDCVKWGREKKKPEIKESYESIKGRSAQAEFRQQWAKNSYKDFKRMSKHETIYEQMENQSGESIP